MRKSRETGHVIWGCTVRGWWYPCNLRVAHAHITVVTRINMGSFGSSLCKHTMHTYMCHVTHAHRQTDHTARPAADRTYVPDTESQTGRPHQKQSSPVLHTRSAHTCSGTLCTQPRHALLPTLPCSDAHVLGRTLCHRHRSAHPCRGRPCRGQPCDAQLWTPNRPCDTRLCDARPCDAQSCDVQPTMRHALRRATLLAPPRSPVL